MYICKCVYVYMYISVYVVLLHAIFVFSYISTVLYLILANSKLQQSTGAHDVTFKVGKNKGCSQSSFIKMMCF